MNLVIQYTLPILVAMLFAYLMVRTLISSDVRKKQLDLLMAQSETSLRLRLQAYERMILLLERIHPLQMVTSQYVNGMTVADLQNASLRQINTEYNHNLAQQVYVDRSTWQKLRDAKESSMTYIAESAAKKNPQADAKALIQEISAQLSSNESFPDTQDAIYYIQKKAQELLNAR